MLSNNEQKERKSRIAAIAGTILFHALVLFLLMILALHSPSASSEEMNVEINDKYSFDSLGNIQTESPVSVTDSKPQTSQDNTYGQKDVGEVKENSLVYKKKTEKPDQAFSAQPKAIVETPDERTIINKILAGGKRTESSPIVNPKSSGKPKDKIKPDATIESAKFDDKSGNGIGVGFDLAGRGYISLPKPSFDQPVEGKIIVSVIVNREGKVIFARAGGRGTTITDIHLRLRAENTARKTIFAANKEAPEEQRGIITYVFEKLK